MEEIVKNKRLNNFRGEVVKSSVIIDNIKKEHNRNLGKKADEISNNIRNSYVQGSAQSNMNDSVTSRRSVRLQKSVFPHLLRMQPDFEHLLDVQGSFDGGTTGGEHDLVKTISKLLNPRDVQKKSALKKRAGGLGSKNMVAKSGPLDMYVLKSEDYT